MRAGATVAAGSRLDCFAFNQFVGAGLNQIPGYVAGECFAYAQLEAPAAGVRRTARPTFRCPAR